MNHYVYLIEKKNALPNQQKYYIGVRSCETTAWEDDYMSSSKYLIEDIEKNSRKDYNKIILKRFNNRKDALNYEIQMHEEFDVANNPLFFNRAKQKTTGFACGRGNLNPFYGRKHTEEYKQRLSVLLKTKDCRQKTTNLGKKFPQAGPKISAWRKEYFETNKHPMLGVKRTEEMRIHNSLGALKQKKHACIYCGIVTIAGNIKRWHNDKCKDKK
jgi:hypothetical protein